MEVAPTPSIKPNFNIKKMEMKKEFTKKVKENEEELKIILGIHDNFIKIIIKEGINNFNCQFNLNDLQSKDKYFRMFDTIEEAYK